MMPKKLNVMTNSLKIFLEYLKVKENLKIMIIVKFGVFSGNCGLNSNITIINLNKLILFKKTKINAI